MSFSTNLKSISILLKRLANKVKDHTETATVYKGRNGSLVSPKTKEPMKKASYGDELDVPPEYIDADLNGNIESSTWLGNEYEDNENDVPVSTPEAIIRSDSDMSSTNGIGSVKTHENATTMTDVLYFVSDSTTEGHLTRNMSKSTATDNSSQIKNTSSALSEIKRFFSVFSWSSDQPAEHATKTLISECIAILWKPCLIMRSYDQITKSGTSTTNCGWFGPK